MAFEYQVMPIGDRSPFGGPRIQSRFSTSWVRTEEMLATEVTHLKGRSVVIEIDVDESALRLDGRLRANAKAASGAVRLAFDTPDLGPLQFATDRFYCAYYDAKMPEDWQHNLRAIAMTMEALRAVDRYGVTKRGEQYTGWKALPGGTGTGPVGGMTSQEALYVMSLATDLNLATDVAHDPDRWRRVIRRARFIAHPDRNDGKSDLWEQVEMAIKVLEPRALNS